MAISLAAITAGGIVIVQDDGDAAAANLHINTTAGTCTRSASPIDFATAQANGWLCTWDQANDLCQNGDTVRVKGGSYGSVTVRGWNSRTDYCTFRSQEGEVVNVSLDTGFYGDCGTPNPQTKWMKIVGNAVRPTNNGFRFKRLSADCNDHMWFENIELDAQPVVTTDADTTHAFSFEQFATNITVLNSNIHNGHNSDAFVVTGVDGLLFEGNDVHDLYNDSPGDVIHDEGFRSNGTINAVIRGNHFWSLKVMDIFLTGSSEEATNWTIENNIFESPTGSAGNAGLGVFFRSGTGCAPACVQPDGVVIRYNTFLTGLGINLDAQAPVTANGLEVYGNYFEYGTPCGQANSTYANNAVPSGGTNCGTGAVTLSGTGSTAGFVDYHPYDGNGGSTNSFEPAGDYHLQAGSPLIGAGSAANAPATDRDGVTRGNPPDIGAYEYVP